MLVEVQAVVVVDKIRGVDVDDDGAGEAAPRIVQAARQADGPALAVRVEHRCVDQNRVGCIGGQRPEKWLRSQLFRQIRVGAVDHIALRVDEGDRQFQLRWQHAVEQPLAACEFIEAQAAVRFLVFELEQLRGMVRLAQGETGMVGQGTRQRLADGHGVAHGAGPLLAHLIVDGRPQRQQQHEREQGHQTDAVQAAGKALQGSRYRYHGRLQARFMEKGRGGVARMIAEIGCLAHKPVAATPIVCSRSVAGLILR
ncbi:hypothetical protein D3C85_223040 [compost metagenome]